MSELNIDRINELAKKAKEGELTPEEIAERKILRENYINSFRSNLKSQLDNTYLVDEDGNETKLGQKEKVETCSCGCCSGEHKHN